MNLTTLYVDPTKNPIPSIPHWALGQFRLAIQDAFD